MKRDLAKELAPFFPGFSPALLGEDDVDAIYALEQGNEAYNQICLGRPVTREDCARELTECPPGFSADGKFFLGFYRDGELLAILDLLEDYPEDGGWYIGLFMVDGARQSGGIGGELMGRFLDFAAASGKERVRLGVIEENAGALSFWTRRGFRESGRKTSKGEGRRDWSIVLMEKKLEPPTK